jgi:hypothetical protein
METQAVNQNDPFNLIPLFSRLASMFRAGLDGNAFVIREEVSNDIRHSKKRLHLIVEPTLHKASDRTDVAFTWKTFPIIISIFRIALNEFASSLQNNERIKLIPYQKEDSYYSFSTLNDDGSECTMLGSRITVAPVFFSPITKCLCRLYDGVPISFGNPNDTDEELAKKISEAFAFDINVAHVSWSSFGEVTANYTFRRMLCVDHAKGKIETSPDECPSCTVQIGVIFTGKYRHDEIGQIQDPEKHTASASFIRERIEALFGNNGVEVFTVDKKETIVGYHTPFTVVAFFGNDFKKATKDGRVIPRPIFKITPYFVHTCEGVCHGKYGILKINVQDWAVGFSKVV